VSDFGWDYPPGVTGNEPQITGEYPTDPHTPYSYFEAAEGGWQVWIGDEEGGEPVGKPYNFETFAAVAVEKLNETAPACKPEQKDGYTACPICGEIFEVDLPDDHDAG